MCPRAASASSADPENESSFVSHHHIVHNQRGGIQVDVAACVCRNAVCIFISASLKNEL